MNLSLSMDDLSTGVDSIDEQHGNIIELAERILDDRVATNDSADRMCDTLTSLVDYVRYHFAAEERLMRDIGDPSFDAHRGWHDLFRLELGELVDASRRSGLNPAIRERLGRMIRSDFCEHVCTSDRQLAALARTTLSIEELKLADSVTLKRAGALMDEVEEQYAATGTLITIGE